MEILRLNNGKRTFEVAVESKDLLFLTGVLETSKLVEWFYIVGYDTSDQQKLINVSGYTKWKYPMYNN